MERKLIPVCEPTLQGNELKYVTEAVHSGWISSAGKYIQQFEEKFSAYCGVNYGVSCSNGTKAIHLALLAVGIKAGDEVILPSFTMIGSCNPIVQIGAKPVFVDSELSTWNMDVNKVEEKITSKTKAIMVVHIYGHPMDMDPLLDLAKKYKLLVIEDAAEAHGAEYKGKKAGSLGDIAAFSFYANKIITCFPPETKIIIEPPKGGKGLSRMKSICDLKVGDSVLTYNLHNSAKEYEKITRTFERDYVDSVFEVVFSNNNRLKMTPNHPVYVINKGWIRADMLVIGDEAIQYTYRGLAYKEMYTGKDYNFIMGVHKAQEKRKLHSFNIRKKHNDPHSRYSQVNWESVAIKIGNANKGKKRSEIEREKLRKIQISRWRAISPEKYQKFCKKIKDLNSTPEMRAKKRSIALKLAKNPEYIKKVSAGVQRAMQNDSYWRNYAKGMNLKPNKPEQFLLSLLDANFPNEFGYNGDYRFNIRIDRLIPDFVHINGKKKIIDILGSHWHAKEEYFTRTERYKKCGYDSLILWEQELKYVDQLKERIKTFLYNPNIKIVKIEKIIKEDYAGKVYNIETEKNHNYFAHGILVHNCGEGGMVLTNNQQWAERARKLRNHFFGEPRFLHQEVGFNYRLTNMQAALGVAQLERIEGLVEARRRNAQLYNSLLKGIPGIILPPEKSWAKNVYWMYGILVDTPFPLSMPQLRDELFKRGIETRTFFIGMHKQPAYQHLEILGEFPNTEYLEKNGFYLPSSSHLKEEEIIYIASCIKQLSGAQRNE